MKTILFRYILFFAASVSLISCEDEDGFYNEKYVNTDQMVSIVGSGDAMAAGDYLTIEAVIPRFIPEPGFSDELDLFASTGGATAFSFSYVIEKQASDGEWEYVDFSDADLNVVYGSAQAGSFILADAEYGETFGQGYFYQAGVRIANPGTYRLSFGVNSDETNIVEFRSRTTGNNINLNLLSSISGLTGGFYTFTVN